MSSIDWVDMTKPPIQLGPSPLNRIWTSVIATLSSSESLRLSVGRGASTRSGFTFLVGLLAAFASGLMSGCGTPAAPQAPSLKLPELVKDLTAERAGSTVTLRWTMPKKTTDHLLLSKQVHGAIPVRICERAQVGADCHTVGSAAFGPETQALFKAALSNAEQSGEPRELLYFVEAQNRSGKSAGLSNAAMVAGGAVPPRISGLRAEVRADGVALHWDAATTATAVRLHRTLLTPPGPKNDKQKGPETSGMGVRLNSNSSSSEPPERDLRVDPKSETNSSVETLKSRNDIGALDPSAKFGAVYQYTAQRIEDVQLGGKAGELDGEISLPVRVEVIDTFPPAVPQGLAAVAVEDEKSIDLSWQPDSEEDLAGYIVYRADADSQDWKRISGAQPVPTPDYRDATVESGHSYRYEISAIDLTGHESKRSTEAAESVPKP